MEVAQLRAYDAGLLPYDKLFSRARRALKNRGELSTHAGLESTKGEPSTAAINEGQTLTTGNCAAKDKHTVEELPASEGDEGRCSTEDHRSTPPTYFNPSDMRADTTKDTSHQQRVESFPASFDVNSRTPPRKARLPVGDKPAIEDHRDQCTAEDAEEKSSTEKRLSNEGNPASQDEAATEDANDNFDAEDKEGRIVVEDKSAIWDKSITEDKPAAENDAVESEATCSTGTMGKAGHEAASPDELLREYRSVRENQGLARMWKMDLQRAHGPLIRISYDGQLP